MQAVRRAFEAENAGGPVLTAAAADALFLRAFDLSRADAGRAAARRRSFLPAFGGGLAVSGLACGLFYYSSVHRPAPRTGSPPAFQRQSADALAAIPAARKKEAALAGRFQPAQAEAALDRGRPALVSRQSDAPPTKAAQKAVMDGSDDMAYINTPPLAALAAATQIAPPESARLRSEIDRVTRRGDDFVTVPFPQIAGLGEKAIRAAATAYRGQREIVDPRLTYQVTLAVKGVSFAALCERLTQETGITLTAGKSVMDDKVTIFCEKRSLRDLMRQISRHFGFSWRRASETGPFEYELYQDVSAQLMEGELRNKDRDEALRALDRAMEKYRVPMNAKINGILSENPMLKPNPEQDKASELDKLNLSMLLSEALPALRLYFGLSPEQFAALTAGQEIRYGEKPDEGDLPLPTAILSTLPTYFEEAARQAEKRVGEKPTYSNFYVTLRLDKSEAGQFSLKSLLMGEEHYQKSYGGTGFGHTLAEGISPSAQNPNNAALNNALAKDKMFQEIVTVQPLPSCALTVGATPNFLTDNPGRKVTSADVMQAIHKATGRDIVADYFTQVYDPETLTARNVTLFDALNRLSDLQRFHWTQEENFLNFRSVRFFYNRQKEIPDRLLERWANSRRKNKRLTVNDLIEIARLSDAQLDSNVIAAGVMANFKLQEWEAARSTQMRPHLRFLGQLAPVSRQAAIEGNGLTFEQLPLGQRLLFAALAFDAARTKKEPNMDDLIGATLRVEYDAPDKPIEKTTEKPLLGFILEGGGGNFTRFIYSAKNKDRWQSIYGPFNAMTRLP